MNADQIREVFSHENVREDSNSSALDVSISQVVVTAEVAAQLAEQNVQLKRIADHCDWLRDVNAQAQQFVAMQKAVQQSRAAAQKAGGKS